MSPFEDPCFIVKAGVFAGQPLFVIYFWELAQAGLVAVTNLDGHPVYSALPDADDQALHSALRGVKAVHFWQDAVGFFQSIIEREE